jgi:hypothetical protein
MDDFRWQEVSGDTHDVQGRERPASHRVHVREGVGRGNLAVHDRIVDNRREEIDGLDERTVAIDAVNTGIVGRSGSDE